MGFEGLCSMMLVKVYACFSPDSHCTFSTFPASDFVHRDLVPLSFCKSSRTACVLQQCVGCDKQASGWLVFFPPQVDASQSMNERFADSSALQLSYKIYKRNAGSEPLLPWLDMNHDQLYHMLVAQVRVGCSSLVEVLSVFYLWFI